ncbi:paraquat-inducible protein A [Klebsiella michiganensis]|nr:paraquat-inducible protein A [Klebsiella michiganensis]
MCDHHHAARHILCRQCDLLVALPQLEHRQKATCPRCGTTLTTSWDAPRQRPTAYALVALFMLLLANLFPFIYMKVGGISSEIELLEIPNVLFTEDYASLGTFFLLFVQLVPAFCLVTILLLVNRVGMPSGLKAFLARILFHLKTWGMAEIFLAGVLVSFVKLMAYGDIGIGLSFIPWCMFCLLQLRTFQCVDRRWLWDDIAPMPPIKQPLKVGVSGLRQGLRSCSCCTAVLPMDEAVCPRCRTRGTARRSEGSYPVAMVIFIASIMVPTLKMIAIGWLCWNASGKGERDSERMHLIYEVVEFVGRWSMIDVFVIAVLSALVRIGGLMNIYPAIGAVMFALVVVMTMFSAMTFDPRLLWDREPDSSREERLQHGK